MLVMLMELEEQNHLIVVHNHNRDLQLSKIDNIVRLTLFLTSLHLMDNLQLRLQSLKRYQVISLNLAHLAFLNMLHLLNSHRLFFKVKTNSQQKLLVNRELKVQGIKTILQLRKQCLYIKGLETLTHLSSNISKVSPLILVEVLLLEQPRELMIILLK